MALHTAVREGTEEVVDAIAVRGEDVRQACTRAIVTTHLVTERAFIAQRIHGGDQVATGHGTAVRVRERGVLGTDDGQRSS